MVAHPKCKSGEPIKVATLRSKKTVLARSILAGGFQCRIRPARGIGAGTNLVRIKSSSPLKNLRGAEVKISIRPPYGRRAFASITEWKGRDSEIAIRINQAPQSLSEPRSSGYASGAVCNVCRKRGIEKSATINFFGLSWT